MTIKTYSNSKNGNTHLEDDFLVKEHASSYSDTVKVDDKLYPFIQKCKDHFKAEFGYITSGYRTDQHSEDVGGYAGDQHTKGTAADFKLKKPDGSYVKANDICCYAQSQGLPGIGKITDYAVHVDYRTSGKWWGDETNGKTVSDWYSYTGTSKPSSNKYPEPTRDLYEGCSKGDDVKWAQVELNNAGYSCGSVDGIFGEKTDTATRNFQVAKKLTKDGIIGKNTRNALKNDGK